MKVLFIVLASSERIIDSAKTISAFKAENPFAYISLLVPKSQEEYAHNLKNVDHVYTIDTSSLKEIVNKKIFSDAYAINKFKKDLAPLEDISWDLIHNYSNNNVSAYLMGYFNAHKKTGAFINEGHLLSHSNTWSAILNTQVQNMNSTITQYTAHQHILGLSSDNGIIPFKLNESNVNKARETFNNLRGNLAKGTRVLGVSLLATENREQKIELLETIINIGGYYPVLFTSFDQTDIDFASEINNHFDEAFVLVETDFQTLPCVILNVDMVITNSTRILALTNSLDTPTVTNLKNAIKTISTENIYFVRKTSIAKRIVDILDHFTSAATTSIPDVYYSYRDRYGVSIKTGDTHQDITSNIKRLATFASMGYPLDSKTKEEFNKNFSVTRFRSLVPNLKDELSKCLKTTLGSIRLLKQYQNSDRQEKAFWAKLSQLFALENENTIAKDFVSLFCAYAYNIDTGIKEENLNQIESQLYNLKNNIQLLNDTLNFINEDRINVQDDTTKIVTTEL